MPPSGLLVLELSSTVAGGSGSGLDQAMIERIAHEL